MKIGFLVWQTGKNHKKGKYKIVYEWEKLQEPNKHRTVDESVSIIVYHSSYTQF